MAAMRMGPDISDVLLMLLSLEDLSVESETRAFHRLPKARRRKAERRQDAADISASLHLGEGKAGRSPRPIGLGL